MSDRSEILGSSDIAAAMGVSRWKTPLQLYAEKLGEVEEADLSDNEAVEMGIELEETVARIFTKRTGMAVRRSPKIYICPDFPWMRCQVDRLITGTDELLECKTASLRKEKEWEGEEIPIEYILQVQWQLMVTGKSIGHIAVLIGGQRFLYKKMVADHEMFDKMKTAALAFWDMVQRKIPPVAMANDNSFMVQLYPTAGEQVKEASEDVTAAIAMLQQTKAQIIDLEATKDEIEAKLKAVIADAKGIMTPEYTAKWINVKGSSYTVTKPDSRQLRITKNKGA